MDRPILITTKVGRKKIYDKSKKKHSNMKSNQNNKQINTKRKDHSISHDDGQAMGEESRHVQMSKCSKHTGEVYELQ